MHPTDAFQMHLGPSAVDTGVGEARYRAIVETLPDAIFVSLEDRIVYVNSTAVRLLGVADRAEIIGRSTLELFHPDSHAALRQQMAQLQVHGGCPSLLTEKLLRRDGSVVGVELSCAPYREGAQSGIVLIARDITERKRLEERFRQVVESAPNVMVMVDGTGRIVLVNAQTESVFGYSRAALIGRPVEMLVPERFRGQHPGFRADFFCAPKARPMGAGRDLYALRQDGTEFPVEIGLNPIHTDEGTMVLAAIVDITERKRLEARFRQVVESAPSAMVMVDGTGRIVLVNGQTEQMFCYSRAALIGQPIELLVPKHLRARHPDLRTDFSTTPQARPMGAGRDLYAVRGDGTEFPVEIGLNPIDTEEGTMVLAAVVDITERKRAQQALEAALQEKTVLLNEVHHRVKNNLQIVSSLLDLQVTHTKEPGIRELLAESQARIKTMALIHQLLYERSDFSRIDLCEYLDGLGTLLRMNYREWQNQIRLRVEVPEAPVYLDLHRIVPCGLFVNELVTNSFKHAFPEGRSGEILIRLRSLAQAEVVLTVSDTGVGLPSGFDLSNSGSLGLQLVPLFADQIHGRLRVEAGPGTCFKLLFSTTTGDDTA